MIFKFKKITVQFFVPGVPQYISGREFMLEHHRQPAGGEVEVQVGALNFIEVGVEIGVKEDHHLLEALRLMIQANLLIIEVTLNKKHV